MTRPLPTAADVRARRDEAEVGMYTAHYQLLSEWIDAEIAELMEENPRVARILQIMRKRESI